MRRPVVVLVLAAVIAAAGVFAWATAARDREYRRLLAAGDAALGSDQSFLAIEAFSGAIALKHDSMVAHLRRGETYRRLGDLHAALRDLRTAAVLDPTATRPLERLGDVLLAQRRFASAADRYTAYIRIDDRSPRVLYKLGLARFEAGDAPAATLSLRQAVHLDDQFAEAFYLLGLSLRAQRHTNEAVWALQRAVRAAPGFVPPREALAALYRDLRRPGDRIDQLEALVALEPDRVDRQIALALAHAEAGRADLALLTLSRAAERSPNEMALYSALGSIWLQQAETRDDHAALGKALEATHTILLHGSPRSEDLLLRGRALLLAGQTASAYRALREATQRLPVSPAAYERLAAVAMRLGRLAEAREALARYSVLVDDDRRQADVLARMADLSVRLRDRPAAVRWMRGAVEHAPHDPALLARLAELEGTTGAVDTGAVQGTSRATTGRSADH
jgi:tetratricopeptide (TPR) repeat protein